MQLRARFAETDQMGVVHHAAYVVWLEAARIEWLRGHGLLYRDLEADGVSLAVSSLEVVYRQAVYFDDLVEVRTRLVEARSRRLVFDYQLWRQDPGRQDSARQDEGGAVLLATARTVHLPTDRRGKAVRLPPRWTQAVGRLLHDLEAAAEAQAEGT